MRAAPVVVEPAQTRKPQGEAPPFAHTSFATAPVAPAHAMPAPMLVAIPSVTGTVMGMVAPLTAAGIWSQARGAWVLHGATLRMPPAMVTSLIVGATRVAGVVLASP